MQQPYTGRRRGEPTDADYDEQWCRRCRSSPCRCDDDEYGLDPDRDDELAALAAMEASDDE